MPFTKFGLDDAILRAVKREGYEIPTAIQSRGIPAVLEGHDLLAAAQTGTGKTAAFTLPILQKLTAAGRGTGKAPRVLVLTPTRELAAQVAESVRTYGRELPIRTAVIFGGVGHAPQIDALRRGVDIIVATPGRLLDHVQERNADLSRIEILVLDEADRMLDMGFIHDIKRILKLLPAKRQNLLFSATFSEEIRQLAKGILHHPMEIDIAPRNTAVESVRQRAVHVDKGNKRQLLSHLIGTGDWQQVLVFTRTKHGANRLCEQLNDDGLAAAALHGNKSQSARTKALADFKANKIRVLVATDIAARGIDIDQLPHVINYELPNVPEDYVHRIGRTGRAGNEGEALSLVSGDERAFLRDIERLIKRSIEVLRVEGFTPRPQAPGSAEQERRPRQQHSRGRPGSGRPGQGRPGQGKSGQGQGRHDPRKQGQSHPQRTQSSDGNSPPRRSGDGRPRHGGGHSHGSGRGRPSGGQHRGGGNR